MSAAAAVVAIDSREAVWARPGEKLRWQIAVAEDAGMSSSARTMGLRQALHCMSSPRWKISVVALGGEVGLKRSQAFDCFAELRERGYVECKDGYVYIIPLGFRQSGKPDSASPENRTPHIEHTRVVESKRLKHQETPTTTAPPVETSPPAVVALSDPESPAEPSRTVADPERAALTDYVCAELRNRGYGSTRRDIYRHLARKTRWDVDFALSEFDNERRRKVCRVGLFLYFLREMQAPPPPPHCRKCSTVFRHPSDDAGGFCWACWEAEYPAAAQRCAELTARQCQAIRADDDVTAQRCFDEIDRIRAAPESVENLTKQNAVQLVND